jgi:hypothetical protein
VDLLVELASVDRNLLERILPAPETSQTLPQMVAATREAIARATRFDPRDINRNFNYSYAAYKQVRRNLSWLVQSGHLKTAMELALQLMSAGSYQVEMSDEGLMLTDVEECLQVVIDAVQTAGLARDEASAWCRDMLSRDCTRFVAKDQLERLLEDFDQMATE